MSRLFYKHLSLVFLLIAALSCSSPSDPEQNVSPYLWEDQTSNFLPQTGEWTNRVEVADLDLDGRVDLIFANGGDYSEPGILEPSRVFLNQGPNQKFLEISDRVFGDQKFYARVIKARDINGDTFPDLIVGATFENQAQLYLGLGDGNFKNVTSTHLPQKLSSIGDLEFGDVEGDGDLDIIIADWGPGNNMTNEGGRTMLWLNDGMGNFRDVTETQMPDKLIQFSWDLEFIDFDNDFDLDIAISCKSCGTSRIFVNNGSGFFQEKRMLPAYTNNYEFEPMDVNSDGFIDLVTVNDGEIVDQETWSRREHIFINDSAKWFIDATSVLWQNSENTGEDDNNVAFVDFDSDGDPDFVLSSLTGEDRLLVNDGNGKFQLRENILSGDPTPHTLSLVFADLNNDHKIDIVMGQGEGEELIEERIFIGTNIQEDQANPKISHYQIQTLDNENTLVLARIHDNKSPSMPQDWKGIFMNVNNEEIPMTWYGEYLWRAEVATLETKPSIEIVATDAAGNQSKIKIQ